MTDEEMIIALRRHADLVAKHDDPDTATALRWAADRIFSLSASHARLLEAAARKADMFRVQNPAGDFQRGQHSAAHNIALAIRGLSAAEGGGDEERR